MTPGRPDSSEMAAPPAAAAFERYTTALGRYLVRRRVRPDDVADLTQEIFELFLRRKARPGVVRDPLRYLYRIASHVIGDAISEERRTPVSFNSQLVAEDARGEVMRSSDEEAEELAVRSDVLAALNQLPEGYLTALLLVEGQGLSYKEAAQASGLSPNTIAMYVMHGRAALKLALDARWSKEPRK